MKVIKVFESESFSQQQKDDITLFLKSVKKIDPIAIIPARYSVEKDQHILAHEEAVKTLFDSQGISALPIICVNDVIIGIGSIPDIVQVRKYIDNATDSSDMDNCCGSGCCSSSK